jgi:transcription elongation factor Elf1
MDDATNQRKRGITLKCKICGKRMNLKAENRQEIKKNKSLGECLTNSGSSMQIYEAFDCPHCGCQNIVNIRECNNKEKANDTHN